MAQKIIKRATILLISLLFCYSFVNAQDFSLHPAKFIKNDSEIANATAGGLNSAQFNEIDINRDGVMDLLVFDRVGNVALPFINKSGEAGEADYRYAAEFKNAFDDLRNWVRIRDYNGDMIPDIFSGGRIPGIELRKGRLDGDRLVFDKLVFDQGAEDVIYFQLSNNSWTQVFVSSGDIPEIIDADQDGDLDILAFEPNGGAFVHFFSNQAIEQGVDLDSFYFQNVDDCFGKFKESGVNQELFLSENMDDCAEGLWVPDVEVRHDGSTISVLDKNRDGLYDLVIGDLTSPNLAYLQNGGNVSTAWMTEQDDNFPRNNVPVDMNIFNAGFNIDVDQDGRKDLLVCPNFSTSNAENLNNVWYYRDVSTEGEADLVLQQKNFLTETMIDMGTGANPVFADVNADGLLDLVVGSVGFYDPLGTKHARLFYFENTGTQTEPEFTLVNEDYLDFSEFNSTSNNYAPTFGDIDQDGDEDLLIGDNKGALYFLENIAGQGNPMDFATPVYNYMDIEIGENSKPQLVDLNGDDLLDIIVGERNGNFGPGELNYAINYFQNIGTAGNPMFNSDENTSPNIPTLGLVNTRDIGFSTPSTSPEFVFLPEKDDFILFCGSESGRIKVYENISGNLGGAFDQIDEEFGSLWEGRRTNIAAADIDMDGYIELCIGNERGGITLVNTPVVIDRQLPAEHLSIAPTVTLYPNPAKHSLNILMESIGEENLRYRIHSLTGQTLQTGSILRNLTTLDISSFPDGIYLIEINAKKYSLTEKFVVIQ